MVSADSPLPQRPMGVPEQFDASVRLYRNHWWYLVPPVILVFLPILLFEGAAGITPSWDVLTFIRDSSFGFYGEDGLFANVTALVSWALFNATVIPLVTLWLHYSVQRYLANLPPKVFPPAKPIAKAWVTWLLTQGIIWIPILIFVVAISSFAPLIERSGSGIGGTGQYFIGFLIVLLILSPFWVIWQAFTYLAIPVSVATGVGPLKALKMGITLFRHQWGIIILVILLMGMAMSVITSTLTGLPVMLLSLPNSFSWATGAIGFTIANTVTIPMTAIINMVLLRDVLIRALGMDLHDGLDRLSAQGIYAPRDPNTVGEVR